MVNCCSEFKLVLILLILAPFFFSITFFLGQTLIIFLKFFQLSVFSLCNIIFKHSSHASNCSSLFSISLFFISHSLLMIVFFLSLLLYPFLLLISLERDTIMIKQIFSFKLQTTRSVWRYVLFRAIKSLSSSFHFLKFKL